LIVLDLPQDLSLLVKCGVARWGSKWHSVQSSAG
jgi:hypothetical protein